MLFRSIELREKAKRVKDFSLSDEIRKRLVDYIGLEVYDFKDGTTEYAFGEKKYVQPSKHEIKFNFFETKLQETFLLKNLSSVSCILLDKKENKYILKWEEPNSYFINIEINAHFNERDKYGKVDFGKKHKGWLVSKEKFESEQELEKLLEKFFTT